MMVAAEARAVRCEPDPERGRASIRAGHHAHALVVTDEIGLAPLVSRGLGLDRADSFSTPIFLIGAESLMRWPRLGHWQAEEEDPHPGHYRDADEPI
jgi:hypothetical protein